MNVLLVEPNYKTTVLPHGLMKIASFHKEQGDDVRYVKGIVYQNTLFNKFKPDRIYITSLFTYQGKEVIKTVHAYREMYPSADLQIGGVFATLMPDYVEAQTGIKPHVGLLLDVEDQRPNYALFPDVDYCLTFTSRGCVRKCKFCAVSKIEKFTILEHWKREINKKKSKIVIQDNNFVATPFEHQTAVVKHILKLDHKPVVDLNSGIDALIFKEKHAELYSKLNMQYVRTAFDGLYQDGYVQRMLELAKKHKMSKQGGIIYVLYNFLDKPEDFYYRIKELLKVALGGVSTCAYPMKYSPLDALDKKFVGEHWTAHMIKALNATMEAYYKNRYVSMGGQSLKEFEAIWGKTGAEFTEKLATANVLKLKSLHKDSSARNTLDIETFEDEEDED